MAQSPDLTALPVSGGECDLDETLHSVADLLSASGNPIVVLDHGLSVVLINEAFESTFHITSAEAHGCLIYDLAGKAWDISEVHDVIDELLAGRGPFIAIDVSHRFDAIENGELFLTARQCGRGVQRLLLMLHGGVSGTLRDAEGRKETESRLRESEERYRLLAETIPQLVWTCTADGECDYLNRQWAEYTGRSVSEQLGHGWVDAVHPDDRDRVCTEWREGIGKKQELHLQYRLKNGEGDYHWFQVIAVPVLDAKGNITKWFGTCSDIEEQKRAQSRLEQIVAERTAKLRQTVDDLQQFSYSITHDMRAPLRSMRAFGHLILMDTQNVFTAESKEHLNRIIAAAERMDRLTQDALNYNRVLQSEWLVYAVDVVPLLRGMIETYPDLQPPKAAIHVQPDMPFVLANETALTQCFSNLLNNAVKFIAPGTVPEVRVRSERRGEFVRLWFEDNGIGVPSSCRERIFDMFQRLDKSREGTGIGLAIVRKLARRLGGEAGVETEPGPGSRFWIDLRACDPGGSSE